MWMICLNFVPILSIPTTRRLVARPPPSLSRAATLREWGVRATTFGRWRVRLTFRRMDHYFQKDGSSTACPPSSAAYRRGCDFLLTRQVIGFRTCTNCIDRRSQYQDYATTALPRAISRKFMAPPRASGRCHKSSRVIAGSTSIPSRIDVEFFPDRRWASLLGKAYRSDHKQGPKVIRRM